MQISIKDIIQVIEAELPPHSQEPWDNCGLQLGSLSEVCTGVLLTLDITEAILVEAKERGCNLVVAHHPLLFKGLKRIGEERYIERCVHYAIRQGIAIYAAHTNADVAPEGLNRLLSEGLGLLDIKLLEPTKLEGYGLGAIGQLPEAKPLDAYLSELRHHFASEQVKHNDAGAKLVQRVALCGGSAAYLWEEARRQGADVFITGEAKYNDYFDAEGITLVTVGHYESEFAVTRLFERIIERTYPGITHITTINHNPVKSL